MVRNPRPLRVRDMQIYRICDGASGILIYLMVLFSPWAFGTTQPRAIWTMNIAGCVLGLLFAVKLAIRHYKDYRAPRWGASGMSARVEAEDESRAIGTATDTPLPSPLPTRASLGEGE